jgi:hypothetical protein
MRLGALTWIIEPIIQGLIDRKRPTEQIALKQIIEPIQGLIDRKRTTGRIALKQIIERIIRELIALTWTMQPIIARLSARMQTIAPIIQGRGPRLQSTPRRIVPLRPIQPHLRTQPPNMQPHNMRLMRALARSRLTNNPWGETNLLS